MNRATGVVEAELLRHESGLSNGHVDLWALAESLGITLVAVPWPDTSVEGKYVRRRGQSFIFMNTALPLLRQRFTLAHELGHHILVGDETDVDFTDDANSFRSKTTEERQANLFASALLMDAHGTSTAAEGLASEDAVAAVARQFEVSPAAAAIRLNELGLMDNATVANLLENLQDPGWRRRFRRNHGLPNSERTTGRGIHLPALYLARVNKLRSVGLLSPDRAQELLERPRPPETSSSASGPSV